MTRYTAYYVTFSGERREYPNLSRAQAVRRHRLLERNARRLDLCSFGFVEYEDHPPTKEF